jgi:hypothetical protein
LVWKDYVTIMGNQLILPAIQQVSPVVVQQPRRDPNWYNGVASEISQFGGQVSALGQDLHEMKVKDELAAAQIADADAWQKFRSGLDQDPDYSTHLSNFEKFHAEHAKQLVAGMTEPVARKAFGNYLQQQQIARRNDVTIYSRAKGGDAIEAGMPEKIEGIMRGVSTFMALDPQGRDVPIGGVQAGDVAAQQYIDSFITNLRPDQIARWQQYRQRMRVVLDKEAQDQANKGWLDQQFAAAIAQSDQESALDLVNGLPAKVFAGEDDRNQLIRRVQIHFNQQAERVEKQHDANRRGLAQKLFDGSLTPEELNTALDTKDVDIPLYSSMMDTLAKPRRPSSEAIFAGHVAVRTQIAGVEAGTVSPDTALADLAKYSNRFTSAENSTYVDQILNAREKWSRGEMDKAKRDLYVAVIKGEVRDLARIDQAYKDKVLTDTEYKDLTKVVTEPQKATAEDTLKAHMQVQLAVSDVAQGRQQSGDAIKLLVSVADRLSPAEGSKYFQDIQEAAKGDTVLASPEVKRGHEFLDQLKTAKVFGGDDPVKNAQWWLETLNTYDSWAKANPQASPDQHRAYLKYLATPITMSWFENQATQDWTNAGIRRLPPEAQATWVQTKGVDSDNWLRAWRKTKKPMTIDVARHYMRIAGGDKAKAAAIAAEDGYTQQP